MSLPQRIREARLRAGLSQAELAHRLGLEDRRDIHQIETRPAPQVLDKIARIAAALEVSPAWLAFGDKETKNALD